MLEGGAVSRSDVAEEEGVEEENRERNPTTERQLSLEEGEGDQASSLEGEPDEDTSAEPEARISSEDYASDESQEDEHSLEVERRRYPGRVRSRATRMTYNTMGGEPSYTTF